MKARVPVCGVLPDGVARAGEPWPADDPARWRVGAVIVDPDHDLLRIVGRLTAAHPNVIRSLVVSIRWHRLGEIARYGGETGQRRRRVAGRREDLLDVRVGQDGGVALGLVRGDLPIAGVLDIDRLWVSGARRVPYVVDHIGVSSVGVGDRTVRVGAASTARILGPVVGLRASPRR